MRTGSLCLLISVVVTAVVALLIGSSRSGLRPPVIRLVSVEPAGMFDENGREMRLLTLAVRNENPPKRRDASRDAFYVEDSARGVEVRMSNSWITVAWATNLWGLGARLGPGDDNQRGLALVPGGNDRCRVWIKYAVPSLSGKGLLEYAVTRLPLSIRSRISYKFWRWVGFPSIYRPGHWRQISVELALRPASGQPGGWESSNATQRGR